MSRCFKIVLLGGYIKMKLSARNQFVGKVIEISEGAVNSVVKVELEGGEVISSTITCEAVKELGLTVDKDVTAIVKATEVMVMA